MRAIRKLAPALGLAVICTLLSAGPAAASHNQLSFFDATNEQSGAVSGATRDQSLDELQALGVNVVRYEVYWRLVAPSADSATMPAGFNPRDPNTYGAGGGNWAPIDAVVRGANARGMQVSLVLSGAPPTGAVPRWASRDPSAASSDPDPKAFQDFAYAVGKRYSGAAGSVGTAQFISIWNEPNSNFFLRAGPGQGPKAVADLYRQLVIAGGAGLRGAGWAGKVLIGEIGPTRPAPLLRPVPFLSRVLCLTNRGKLGPGCSKLDVAGIAHHPYSFGRAPYLPALNGGQIAMSNLSELIHLTNRAARGGAISRGARVYVTEYGYPTRPDAPTGVTRLQQAEFIAIGEYMAYNMPGVAAYAQYLMRDDPKGSPAYGFTSGLCPHGAPDTVTSNGAGCKPGFGAYRTPLVVRSRALGKCGVSGKGRAGCVRSALSGPVTIWGHIRPAKGPTTALVRFRDGTGVPQTLRAIRTDASGYFQFTAQSKPGRTWSVGWNGASGPFVRAFGF